VPVFKFYLSPISIIYIQGGLFHRFIHILVRHLRNTSFARTLVLLNSVIVRYCPQYILRQDTSLAKQRYCPLGQRLPNITSADLHRLLSCELLYRCTRLGTVSWFQRHDVEHRQLSLVLWHSDARDPAHIHTFRRPMPPLRRSADLEATSTVAEGSMSNVGLETIL